MENSSFLKAEALMKQQDYAAALDHYTKAVKEEAKNPVIHSQLGVCYFHLKNLDAALSSMDEALKLDPDYSYRYASRAYIKDAKGDVVGAIEDYKKAIELDPDDAVNFNNLGLLEEKLGYIEASKKNFKKADELAKMLEETGIVTESELMASPAAHPVNIQKELDQKEDTKNHSNVAKEVSKVFSKKETFKEFISFVRNGFKTKD